MSLKNFVIKEIRNMKSFNKSNFKPKINNSLFDTSEHLISSQNEKIKFLLNEINNKSLAIEALLENLKDRTFSYRSDLSTFNNPCEK